MRHYSPLRYPGGKGKIANYFKTIFELNNLIDGVYVEPYAGGASIALSLLFSGYASKVIVNDINISIFAFWSSVLNNTEELSKLIRDTPVTIKTWEHLREIQNSKREFDLLELGFSTFFLNRSNRSGILDAGVIGGRNQSGKWKIDARFNKGELINRIEQIALYRDRIEVYNFDAIELIRRLKNTLPSKTLFYMDPPYYLKGRDLYLNYYDKADHVAVAKEIKKIVNQTWVVTYDRIPFIQRLYRNYPQLEYTLNYSASKAHKGNELMVFSNNISIPNLQLQS